ncbi:MAG TPA: nitrate- and nitrite sensing domain-containing protein [Rugosimonospora sp.]
MKSRSLHVRTKILALLLSLAALWVFAAVVTVRDGLNLLWVNTMNEKIGKPNTSLVEDLQQERRLSVVYLATHGDAQRTALTAQRTRTDDALGQFRESTDGRDVHLASSAELQHRITQAFTSLGGLGQIRDQVDALQTDRNQAAAAYTNVIDVQFRIYGSLTSFSDQDIAKEASTLVSLDQAGEVLSEEDALAAGALSAGQFTTTELQQFVQLVGVQQYLYAQADAQLSPAVHAQYQQMVTGPDYARFTDLENQLRTRAKAGATPPLTAAAWQEAIDPVNKALSNLVIDGANQAVKDAEPAAIWVLVRLILAGGLGLIAVIASIIVSVTTARSLVRQLELLRTAARELAERRLPGVVSRLQHGDEVDVAAEAPPLEFGNDEIGQLGHAFNAVQETAVRVAVEQAELRRSVRDVFLSLARRSQALVHRQLQLLDGMERREHDAEELDELFRIDHLATRMRRNAENLIVLSGAVAGRGWRNPVPMVDVIRGALAEVEEYARVTVLPIESAALAGRAVGDVIHLLAELIENAVSFSPPYTNVQVGGALVANGFAVEIEDRGLGMSDADLAKTNEQLATPPEFNLSSTAQLGLFVVGRLADRHGVRVRLRESPYGGTTAIVLIPSILVVDPQDATVRGRRAGRPALQVGDQSGRPAITDGTTSAGITAPTIATPGIAAAGGTPAPGATAAAGGAGIAAPAAGITAAPGDGSATPGTTTYGTATPGAPTSSSPASGAPMSGAPASGTAIAGSPISGASVGTAPHGLVAPDGPADAVVAPAPAGPTPRPAPGAGSRQAIGPDGMPTGPRPRTAPPATDRQMAQRVIEVTPTAAPDRTPEPTAAPDRTSEGSAATPGDPNPFGVSGNANPFGGPSAELFGAPDGSRSGPAAAAAFGPATAAESTFGPSAGSAGDVFGPAGDVFGSDRDAFDSDSDAFGPTGDPSGSVGDGFPSASGQAAAYPPPPDRIGDDGPVDSLPRRSSTAQQDPSGDPVILTPAGLPWRRRQASLAAPLRAEPPDAGGADAGRQEQPARRPEEIRRMMSSYQTGTRRGRAEADRVTERDADQTSGYDSDRATESGTDRVTGRAAAYPAGETTGPTTEQAGNYASHRAPEPPGGRPPSPGSPAAPQPPTETADDQQS